MIIDPEKAAEKAQAQTRQAAVDEQDPPSPTYSPEQLDSAAATESLPTYEESTQGRSAPATVVSSTPAPTIPPPSPRGFAPLPGPPPSTAPNGLPPSQLLPNGMVGIPPVSMYAAYAPSVGTTASLPLSARDLRKMERLRRKEARHEARALRHEQRRERHALRSERHAAREVAREQRHAQKALSRDMKRQAKAARKPGMGMGVMQKSRSVESVESSESEREDSSESESTSGSADDERERERRQEWRRRKGRELPPAGYSSVTA